MNKILVSIYVVSIDNEYNLLLPIGKKVSEVVDLIQDSLIDLSDNNYIKKKDVILYNSDGLIINQNNLVKYSGMKNGTKICLL